MSLLCEFCHHPLHAGRCFVILGKGTHVAYCPCRHRREEPDGIDQPASSDRRSPAVRPADGAGDAPVTTIHDVDRAWDALGNACEKYVREKMR